MLPCGVQQPIEIEVVGLALTQESTGGMAEHPQMRVTDGTHDPLGHRLLVLTEGGMDRGDYKVQFRQDAIGEIQSPVGPDIRLDAGEDPKVPEALIQPVDLFPLPCQVLRCEAADNS